MRWFCTVLLQLFKKNILNEVETQSLDIEINNTVRSCWNSFICTQLSPPPPPQPSQLREPEKTHLIVIFKTRGKYALEPSRAFRRIVVIFVRNWFEREWIIGNFSHSPLQMCCHVIFSGEPVERKWILIWGAKKYVLPSLSIYYTIHKCVFFGLENIFYCMEIFTDY